MLRSFIHPFLHTTPSRVPLSIGIHSRLACRFFTSHRDNDKQQQQGDEDKTTDTRDALLEATLTHVPQHGWTMKSMTLGAADLGLPSVVHGVFPGGPSGLIDAYLVDCQRRFTLAVIKGGEHWQPNASVTDRVRALTVLRLGLLKPVVRQWPEALAILAKPYNLSLGFHHLSTVVDDIWYYAGDRSPDMDWYTKRASLATIYSATELYMSQDVSPEFVETYRFLDRRLNEAECVGTTTRQLGTMLSFGAKSLVGAVAQRGPN